MAAACAVSTPSFHAGPRDRAVLVGIQHLNAVEAFKRQHYLSSLRDGTS